MVAISAPQSKDTLQNGPRPFDLRRDLRQVSDLIARSFADELETSSHAALRELRWFSRLGPILAVLGHRDDFYNLFGGYVWEEDGRIVGNVTVQCTDSYGSRWQIANVAVERGWRGRGIARQLMGEVIEHIRTQNGDWAVLQVRQDNEVARGLYERMGFEAISGATDMRLERVPSVLPAGKADGLPMQELSTEAWYHVYNLASAATPALAQWWRTVRTEHFDIGLDQQLGEFLRRIVGWQRVYRRGLPGDPNPRYRAAYQLRASRWPGEHRLEFWVHPNDQSNLEEQVVLHALNTLRDYPRWPVTISHLAEDEAAIAVLRKFGFVTIRTLVTMRLSVSGGSGVNSAERLDRKVQQR